MWQIQGVLNNTWYNIKCYAETTFWTTKNRFSLKHFTFNKTDFVVYITTFQMCLDIQDLKLSEDALKVTHKGMCFLKHWQTLSKQDNSLHFGFIVFVSAFRKKWIQDSKYTDCFYLYMNLIRMSYFWHLFTLFSQH